MPRTVTVMPTRLLSVTGMHCEHCSGRVEQVLRALPGVDEATVDLETEVAVVFGRVPVSELIASVVAARRKPHVHGSRLRAKSTQRVPKTQTRSPSGRRCWCAI